jgi:tetratricopeptide (TPR) repeat protein
MTPYTRRILKILGAILGFITISNLVHGVHAFYINYPHPAYLIVTGLLLIPIILVCCYYYALGELRDPLFYLPVHRLKHDFKKRSEDLDIRSYQDYYLLRSIDNDIRNKLKRNEGVLVVGAPLSGKTRAGIEAIFDSLPRAFFLWIDQAHWKPEIIDKLVIPCFLVFFRKPEVVLFFDKIDTLKPALIERLILRLKDQTSSYYIVSTWDSGSNVERVQSIQNRGRSSHFEPVYLPDLVKKEQDEIYSKVWKNQAQQLLIDYSLPGYIILGSNPIVGKVRLLPKEDKKVIQALLIAAICGASDGDEKLFWEILDNVLDLRPPDRLTLLNRFIEQGIIRVQNPHVTAKPVLIQHISYLNEAYDDLSKFKQDLARLANWLFEKGDAQRMAALGSHYLNVLSDSSSARNVYERVIKLNDKEVSYLLTLAALYAQIGEPNLETETLNKALALTPKPVEQAQTLISHGDALLYRLARPADSIDCYNRAFHLIEDLGESKTHELVRRRSGDCLLITRQYAKAEPYFRRWQAGAKGDDLLAASERLALSLIGQGRNSDADNMLHDLWRTLPCDKRSGWAIQLLVDSEGCLDDEVSVKAVSQIAFDCFVAGAIEAPDLKTRCDEIVLFGYQVLCSGFLLPSELAHTYLIDSSDELGLDRGDQSAIWINLGFTRHLFGRAEAAREAYKKALSIASATPNIDWFIAGAEAGLGDCDLLVGRIEEGKKHYEHALKIAKNPINDASSFNWAQFGLGDVALAEREYTEAGKHFLEVDRILDSYQQLMRLWLGMARVKIKAQEWEEAESFLMRGLSLPMRRDFALRRQEFQKEYDSLPKRVTFL